MSKQFYLPMRDANDPHKVTLIPVSEDVYANITPETNLSAAATSIMDSAAARSSTFGNVTETVTSASIVLPGTTFPSIMRRKCTATPSQIHLIPKKSSPTRS